MRVGAFIIAGILTVSSVFVQGKAIATYAESGVSTDGLSGSINEIKIPGTVTTQSEYNDSFLSVTGFASVAAPGSTAVSDRSQYVGTEFYRTINNEIEFLDAIVAAQQGLVKVMEITTDMNLGWEELTLQLGKAPNKAGYNWVAKYGTPSNELKNVTGGFTNPLMQKSGVSKISISNINGLTIFSKNGSSIKHAEIKLNASCVDFVIRNLTFKEMWQWDDRGTQKEIGWSNLKVYGKNIWIDHCSFEMASDDNIDMENGATGITISWCEVGIEATENPSKDSSIYQSIMFMEDRYQGNITDPLYKLDPATSLYYKLRAGDATPEQIMAYSAYHKKCHLTGSGDKDFVNYVNSAGVVTEDANSNLNLTLAYNHYSNVGQRVPMIRQGTGNLINCYIDNTTHKGAEAASAILGQIGPYHLTRALNSRNGASIAADSCVFEGVEEPITGSEIQGNDTGNMDPLWAHLFQKAQNHVLIVNSTVTNSKGTYTGSSWDNYGDNLFTTGFKWIDKSTLGKWAWYSAIVNKESYNKSVPPKITDAPFEFTYASETALPFQYQLLPLADVKAVVTEKSGSGTIAMSADEWLKTAYLADADYSVVKAAIEKANSLNASDYVDFTSVTNAINAVIEGLKSDKQESVEAMAITIQNAINSLVKKAVEVSPVIDVIDKTTGVSVHADAGVLPEGAKFVVEPILSGSDYDKAYALLENVGNKFVLFEVHFVNEEGSTLQPNGTVTVSYKIPEGFKSNNVVLFRINEDGSKTLIPGTVQDGKYIVTAKSFSRYALVEEEVKQPDVQENVATGELTNNANTTIVVDQPKTGDNKNVLMLAILMVVSSGVACTAFALKRRKTNKE